jgi:hypothetical protein
MSVKQQHLIDHARTVFVFCFADEPKISEFQIALGIDSNKVEAGFYTFIEECLIAEFTRIYLEGRVTETIDEMGFKSVIKTPNDPANHLHFLDYQFEVATDKEAFFDVVKERVLRPGKTFANGFLLSHEALDSQLRSEIKDWLSGAKRHLKLFAKDIIKKKDSRAILKSQPQAPKNFADLFADGYKKHCEAFINILREVTPDLVDANTNWIKCKGASIVFYQQMVSAGVMINNVNQKAAVVFEKTFNGLSKSSFVKTPIPYKAEEYRVDFKERITMLKISIDSQTNI